MKGTSANDWLADAKKLFDEYQVGWAWLAERGLGDVNSVPDCLQSPATTPIPSQTPPVLQAIFNFRNPTNDWSTILARHMWIR
jgi:hypothetical protein